MGRSESLAPKFPAPSFTATAKVTFTPLNDGERTGLIVTGLDYAYLSVEKKQDGLYISQTVCQNADKGSPEKETAGLKLDNNTFWLRVRVEENAVCSFSYSLNGRTYTPWASSSTHVRANGLVRSWYLRNRQRALRPKWDTQIMTGSELNKRLAFLCLLCGSLAERYGAVKLQPSLAGSENRSAIRAADRLSYDVLLNGSPLLQNSTLLMNINNLGLVFGQE